MRQFGASLVAALVLAVAPSVQAETLHLKFATLSPPQAHLNARFFKPWVKRLNASAGDAMTVETVDGYALANNSNIYDRVLSDVVQIGWTVANYAGPRFTLTDVVALPFAADKSEYASTALWRLYERGMFGNAFDEVQPFYMVVFPQQLLHMSKTPVRTLADLQGLKLRAGGRVVSQIVEALGATPISISLGNMYQGVQRGTVDGVVMPWSAFNPFKLAEVTHYHTQALLGSAAAMIFMSKKKYLGLSAAARTAFERNSGEKLTREFGVFWDTVQQGGLDSTKAKPGHTFITLDPAEEQRWIERTKTVTARWVKTTPGGAKVYDAFEAEIAKLKAGD